MDLECEPMRHRANARVVPSARSLSSAPTGVGASVCAGVVGFHVVQGGRQLFLVRPSLKRWDNGAHLARVGRGFLAKPGFSRREPQVPTNYMFVR